MGPEMLFANIGILDDTLHYQANRFVGVRDGKIACICDTEPQEDFGERYDGTGKLLMPGFYNAHSHSAMTLLRGYAEDLSLSDWLNKKVLQAGEDRAALVEKNIDSQACGDVPSIFF